MKQNSSKIKIHRVRRNSLKRRRPSKTIHSNQSLTKSTKHPPVNTQELKDESKVSIFTFDEISQHSKSSWKRQNRIDPTEFTLDVFEKPKKKKRRQSSIKGWHVVLCAFLSLLFIGGIIGAVIYTLTRPKTTTNSSTTESNLSTLTTTLVSAYSSGATTCSSPILDWPRTNGCNRSSSSYVHFTCCYRTTTTSQLTIRFKLQETVTQWYIDDVSLKQNSRELINNGGFESNLTDWTVLLWNNSTWSSFVEWSPGLSHTGSMYLRSSAASGPDFILQTVNVTQGQDVNVSFWWFDEGGVSVPGDICEGTVLLIP